MSDCDEAALVCLVEAGEEGTIDIQYADDLAPRMEWHHDFGARGRIAGYMAGKAVHVCDELHLVACGGGATDALAIRYVDAGDLAGKGAEYQLRLAKARV